MGFLFAFFIAHASAQSFGRLGPYGTNSNHLTNPDHWMAIVGDSGVTGAASAEDLEPTLANLMGHALGFFSDSRMGGRLPLLSEFPSPPRFGIESIMPMTRIPYSKSEFRAAGGKLGIFLLNASAKLSLRLDSQEHSFGYMVGRSLGVKSADIVLVGQDGVMVETVAKQFERIYEMKTQTLPPLILLSYTANDLCDEKVFEQSVAERAAQFSSALKKTWSEARPFLKAHPHGTQIVVLAPFDVVNVITNPEILAQKVNVEGQGQITCGQLRHGEAHVSPSSWLIMRMLNLMCPSVTKTHPGDIFRLERLRDVQHAFGEAWKTQINELNASADGIKWTYLDNVRDIPFTTGDVGNDCFHPSVRGHAKLADFVLQRLDKTTLK